MVMGFVVGTLLYAGINSVRFLSEQISRHQKEPSHSLTHPMNRSDVAMLLSGTSLMNRPVGRFEITHNGQRLWVNTSLSEDLQKVLTEKLNPRHALYIGIVAMTPTDGRVVGLAGFDRTNTVADPSIAGSFPAASVFKIVTAAAALDMGVLTADSVLSFNGQKHTLYRSQLKTKKNRYTNRISLTSAFAESVNPVFGKIGMYELGSQALQDAARRFAFDREIPFAKTVTPSRFEITEDPYGLAELASGFNRDTRMSPLHGAMMVAAIANAGRLPQPRIIDDIYDENGRRMYTGTTATLATAVSADGAAAIWDMMRKTVASGTCRKIFYPYRRDKVLSKLVIGGKSGSIDNRDHDARYDWFVGFAADKHREKVLVVAALVAHQEYIGVRAGDYARHAFKQYFMKPR